MSNQERLAALGADHFMEFIGNKNPKCPHCGSIYDIAEEGAWHLYDSSESEHEIECPACDLPFIVAVAVSYTFSTEDQEEEEEDE
jgi:uncharacterized Zn-finger protein